MDTEEIEGEAEALYARASIDPTHPPRAWELARALGVPVEFFVGLPCAACSLRTSAGHRIRLRKGLSAAGAHWLAGHELAEITWDEKRPRPWGDPERLSNRLAASIVAPRAAMRRVVGELGFDPSAIAAALTVSTKTAALRLGELGLAGVAILDGLWITTRGPVEWPPAWELRRLVAHRELPRDVQRFETASGAVILIADPP